MHVEQGLDDELDAGFGGCLCVTVGSSVAQAQDWEQVYKGGTRTATAGAITGGAGVGAMAIGVGMAYNAMASGDFEGAGGGLGVVIVGAMGVVVGPSLMAGGSVRANRALRELGYEKRSSGSWVRHMGTVGK